MLLPQKIKYGAKNPKNTTPSLKINTSSIKKIIAVERKYRNDNMLLSLNDERANT